MCALGSLWQWGGFGRTVGGALAYVANRPGLSLRAGQQSGRKRHRACAALGAVEVLAFGLFAMADQLPTGTEAVPVSIRAADVLLMPPGWVAKASAAESRRWSTRRRRTARTRRRRLCRRSSLGAIALIHLRKARAGTLVTAITPTFQLPTHFPPLPAMKNPAHPFLACGCSRANAKAFATRRTP